MKIKSIKSFKVFSIILVTLLGFFSFPVWAFTTSTVTLDSAVNFSQPAIAIDSADSIYIAYVDTAPLSGKPLKLAKSTDNGATWSISTIENGMSGLNPFSVDDPDIAIDTNDNIYVSYKDETNGDLKLATSTNGGGSFTKETVDSSSANVGNVSSIATKMRITSSGKNVTDVYIAYQDYTGGIIKLGKKASGSWSFSTVGSWGITGDQTAIIVRGSRVDVAYTAQSLYLNLATSTDGGATFTSSNISNFTSTYSGAVTFNPSLAWDNNQLYLAGYAQAYGGSTTTYYTVAAMYSSDHGATWTGCTPLESASVWSNGGFPSSNSGYKTDLAVGGNEMYVTYYDALNSRLRFGYSSDHCATWSVSNIATSGDGLNPTLAVDSIGDIFIGHDDGTTLEATKLE